MNCNIVRDLLPIYIDGLTSEETAIEIQEHLQGCVECNKLFEEMKCPIESINLEAENREINYLKKIKAKAVKKLVIIIAIILFIFSILTYLFVIGSPVKMKDMEYTQSVENGKLRIDFNLINGKELNMKTKYLTEETTEGTTQIIIIKPYEVLPSPIYDGTKFTYGYKLAINEEGLSDKEKAFMEKARKRAGLTEKQLGKMKIIQVKVIIQFADDEVVIIPDKILK
ncbi:hypothetical protein CLHOM_00180 [Clostridium homopropionicum DSM 5847]|uniref:Putative zinc-finger domain-containing protein n=1 Tax=Clostridium homopropionicum DSM 5847 TaxID=1121318 RepID=A0A0L6ZEZ3_9CLOT|nr:zf-HC2 domain-containing protein [Clostridium homopropionicum]KOA21559.1 hypothetical protein CLHOM_00180 [Clostridium homopropionicum DSM 5847]SFH00018.1 Putative zinc-finger [Clostridium homopropionicum]